MNDPLLRFGTTMADSPEIETRLRGLLAPGKPAFTKPATLVALTGLGVVALSVLGVHYRTRSVVSEPVLAGQATVAVDTVMLKAAPPEITDAPMPPQSVEPPMPPEPGENPGAELKKVIELRHRYEVQWRDMSRARERLRKSGSPDAELLDANLKVQRETYEALLRREQDLQIQRNLPNWPDRATPPTTQIVTVAPPAPAPEPTAAPISLRVRRDSTVDRLRGQEAERQDMILKGWRPESAGVRNVDAQIARTRADLAALDVSLVREVRR